MRALISLKFFADSTFTKTLNKSIDFSIPSLSTSPSTSITSENHSPDPGACFLCNGCPDDDEEEDQDSNAEDCPSRPRGEGSASCVETTAYALQTLVMVRDTELTVCLAQWLVQIKSASGGFYSSQVNADEEHIQE